MPYCFLPNEPLDAGITRIFLEQIRCAEKALGKKGGARVHGVHDARKCFKRIRALLRLTRPLLGEKRFQTENKRFRNIARSLSLARDSQAMIESLVRLRAAHPKIEKNPITRPLLNSLKQRRKKLESTIDSGLISCQLRKLTAAENQFRRLETGSSAFEDIIEAFRAEYARSKRSMAKAYRTDHIDDFHEWRKAIQAHWRHMQLVRNAWPEIYSVRIAAAHEISELLGDHNDLEVLMTHVAQEAVTFATKRKLNDFRDICRERQGVLKCAAGPRGERLLAEPPRSFANRFVAYWQSAKALRQAEGAPAHTHSR